MNEERRGLLADTTSFAKGVHKNTVENWEHPLTPEDYFKRALANKDDPASEKLNAIDRAVAIIQMGNDDIGASILNGMQSPYSNHPFQNPRNIRRMPFKAAPGLDENDITSPRDPHRSYNRRAIRHNRLYDLTPLGAQITTQVGAGLNYFGGLQALKYAAKLGKMG